MYKVKPIGVLLPKKTILVCTFVFGNGDVDSPQTAQQKRDKYGVDGIMIGRAAIGYPGYSMK